MSQNTNTFSKDAICVVAPTLSLKIPNESEPQHSF
jgi:hypothetical protein